MAVSDSALDIPVVDFDGSSAALREGLARACERWGIFYLVNHTVPDAVIDRASAASRSFFEQPLSAKQALARTLDNPWGYYDRELTRNLRDRKEIFDFGPGWKIPWPDYPAAFRESLETHANACYALGLQLLDLLDDALGLDQPCLKSDFEPGHSSFTRLNYYPVSDALQDTDAPAAGPLGISRHTDAGGLTILLQDEVAGLQAFHEGWHDVKPLKGALTINIGDMMQVWSNDRFTAPLHRVRASEDRARYSIAYFLNPDRDCVVQPLLSPSDRDASPRYRPVPWSEFRDLRAKGDYGDYGEEVQITHYRLEG